MYLIHNLQSIPTALKHAVVTIGNFDGVHLGHQQLLAQLKARAIALKCPCGVMVFEPQPQEFFISNPPKRLTSFRQKFQLIAQQGIDFMMVLRFNRQLAAQSAQDFIDTVLVRQLQAQEIWVGADFRFGHQRLGDVALLTTQGQQHGFKVHTMPDVTYQDARISSTQIRNLLTQGQLQVKPLLGRYFTLEGKVIAGDARGRTLNMPTANIRPHKTIPLQGIFVVRAQLDGQYLPGVASIGVRPVFAGKETLLEVHLIDFNQDIYGKRLTVEFLHKLRNEENFASVALLQQQMQQDLFMAKKYWEMHHDKL